MSKYEKTRIRHFHQDESLLTSGGQREGAATQRNQEWLKQDDGTFLNSSHHEHRKVKWLDILFDLALVGFQLHIWKMMTHLFSEEKFFDGISIAVISYSFLMTIWKHVTLDRNRYHGNGALDTFMMFAYLIGLVTAINGLHSCVVAASCEMVPHGQCTVLGMGTIVCYLLSGVISFYRAFCANDEPMKRPLILEGCLVLVATIPWFMAVADVPLFDYTWLVFLTAVAPIVAPPLIYMGCSSRFRQSFQPVNIAYFAERVGLCVVVNLAVLVESSIADVCDGLAPVSQFCTAHHRRLSDHSNQGGNGTAAASHHTPSWTDNFHTNVPKFQAVIFALFVKVLYFNVYRPSEIEENTSRSRYPMMVDANVILITTLAVGLSIISSETQLSLCEFDYHKTHGVYPPYAENNNAVLESLAIGGEIIVFVALSGWHLLHTRNGFNHEESGASWTKKQLLMAAVCRIACTGVGVVLVLAIEEIWVDVFIFILTFAAFLWIETRFIKTPHAYGKIVDTILVLKHGGHDDKSHAQKSPNNPKEVELSDRENKNSWVNPAAAERASRV